MLDLAAPWRLSAAGASAAVSRATASAAIVCVGRRMAAARAVVTAIVAPAGTSAARTASATVAGLIVVAPGIAGATRSSQHFLAARTVKAVGTGAVRTRGTAASAVEALLARAIAIGSAATGALRTGGAVEALPARAAFIARTAVRAIAIGAAAATVATRLRVGSLLRAHAGLSCALASRRLGRGLESLVARAVLASRLGSASGRLSLGPWRLRRKSAWNEV